MRKLLMLMALLTLAGGLLAGCGAQTTAPEIIQHMKDTAAQTSDVHMVLDLNMDVTQAANTAPKTGPLADLPTSGKATIELWYKKPNLVRAEVRSVEPGEYKGATLINDGKALWAYDPAHKMAYKLDVSALQGAGKMANVPTDIQELLSDPDLATALDRVLSFTDAKLDGTEQVAGFNTYKLTLTPKADTGLANAALGVQATMWVDQVTWTVVKLEATSTQANFSYSAQSLDFNKGVADETFKFTLPEGARGIDLTMFAPRSVTLDEAQAAAAKAGTPLLTPSYVPSGATLIGVTAMPMGRGYLLSYSGSARVPSFVIYQGSGGGKTPFGDLDPMEKMMGGARPEGAKVETVQVRGVEGTVFSHQADAAGTGTREGTFVTWQEKDSTLRIGLGGELSLAEALKIAESLK
jgi:outer membrane lipoprotein-sorting protein